MGKSKNLVFFGTELFSLSALKALVDNGFTVSSVVTKPDSKRGRGGVLTAPAVKTYALEQGIPVIQESDMHKVADELKQYGCETAVLSAFGRIIPKFILDMFNDGIVNVHPSLLPKHRGASPVEQAILNGDEKTGVSLMKLVKEMDAGPIYAQIEHHLNGTETAPELYQSLADLGSKLLVEHLPAILSGETQLQPQNDSQATFAPILSKQDGEIDWSMPVYKIERQVRAFLGWPGTRTTLSGKEIIITRAHVSETGGIPGKVATTSTNIAVACGTGSLIVESLKPVGKREMTAKEYLAGHKII